MFCQVKYFAGPIFFVISFAICFSDILAVRRSGRGIDNYYYYPIDTSDVTELNQIRCVDYDGHVSGKYDKYNISLHLKSIKFLAITIFKHYLKMNILKLKVQMAIFMLTSSSPSRHRSNL